MSTIVWDGETLATNSEINDGHTCREVTRLWKFGNLILGGVGDIDGIMDQYDWVLKGRNPASYPSHNLSRDNHFLFVRPNTGLLRYIRSTPNPIVHGNNKCAFGTGSDFAYGALHMGASAEQAVDAAIKYDLHTTGHVVSFRME